MGGLENKTSTPDEHLEPFDDPHESLGFFFDLTMILLSFREPLSHMNHGFLTPIRVSPEEHPRRCLSDWHQPRQPAFDGGRSAPGGEDS